ncbi:MAG: DoxX family protein [Planctomycetota bacterium]
MTKQNIIGWVLSILVALFLAVGSASSKFTEWEGKAEMFDHIGYSPGVMFNIGIVEVSVVLLFIIPRTSFLGAVLLTAYLGGATSAHVRVGDPFFVPIVIAVVSWIALGLRDTRVFQMAFPFGKNETPIVEVSDK